MKRNFTKIKWLLLLLVCLPAAAFSQTKYWVFFTDKNGSEKGFDPYKYFHKNALERRMNAGLPLYDLTDLPVNENYFSQVSQLVDSMGNISRWFNGTGVWATDVQIKKVAALPFVKSVEIMTNYGRPATYETEKDEKDIAKDVELVYLQTQILDAKKFHDKNITGKGIRIAILDVGFKGADKHPAFKHIFEKGNVKLTHDFIKNKDFVYGYGTHGTMVMSCIAGKYHDSIAIGLAPDAEFLLARTERAITEWKDEEDNWVAAAEWADKNGAHLLNSSLGYTYKRYFYRDMNGRVSYVALGANMAARKGILVVTAAGNDGDNNWKYICTPGDADSALTVGATDPKTGYHINFSSYGPSADERLKPNVSAPGHVFVANDKDFGASFGTSFSTPLVTGFAACVWSMNMKFTNMQLFGELERSASLYPYFDYAHGYGIPRADYFISKYGSEKNAPDAPQQETFKFISNDDEIKIRLVAELAEKPKDEYLKVYYQVWNADGILIKYYVAEADSDNDMIIKRTELPQGGKIRAHYAGYTSELKY